jgi:hypothetical protein
MEIFRIEEYAKQETGKSRRPIAYRMLLLVSCLAYSSTLKIEAMLLRNAGLSPNYTALNNPEDHTLYFPFVSNAVIVGHYVLDIKLMDLKRM